MGAKWIYDLRLRTAVSYWLECLETLYRGILLGRIPLKILGWCVCKRCVFVEAEAA
jgi:hypothetical protein